MERPGFDWLNLPPNTQGNGPDNGSTWTPGSRLNSGSASPAPQVSFGIGNSETRLSSDNGGRPYQFSNPLADSVLHSHDSHGHSYNGYHGNDETSIPLSLTTQDLTLEESRTYIRWYSDILSRTNSRTISMNDVYNFMNNFRLSSELKELVNKLFHKILNSINIGEFFALLRVISHCLNGQEPSRRLIRVSAPIPTPPSILSKKRQNHDDYNDDNDDNAYDNNLPNNQADNNEPQKPLDLDSFTAFMLTGERPDDKPRKRKKKLKSVKFSDQMVTDIHDSVQITSPSTSPQPEPLDYSLPMDQLLNRINSQPSSNNHTGLAGDDEEQQILEDMAPQMNHFRNLNSVDTASIDGVPASIHLHNGHSSEQLLQPNMTGPAQMSQYYAHQHQDPDQRSPSPSFNSNQSDNLAPLKPNVTGPYDMMRMFAPDQEQQQQQQHFQPEPQPQPQQQQPQPSQPLPKISLQSFTDQMTGSTGSNTSANARSSSGGSTPIDYSNRPLPPPPVPEARRTRSASSPIPYKIPSPPTASNSGIPPPVPPSRLSQGTGKPAPPPPPPSRRRGTSSATSNPPLPPKAPQESSMYSNSANSDSTGNILDDLKSLQEEVDRIRDMTGGF